MKKIKIFLGKWGLHSFLLPVFFVLHNYLQYYGLVSAAVAIQLLAEITGGIVLFFLLLYLLTKNAARAFQLTTITSFIFLFYGAIKDFAGKTLKLPFLASYKFLLPVTAAVMVLLYAVILRKRHFTKINLFQNVLLLLFILADASLALFTKSETFFGYNLLAKKNILNIAAVHPAAQKPDVYYLLFDCYPGRIFLTDYMQFDNGSLDSVLQNRGFHIISNPRSNYNRTVFSMASALNFEYLNGFNNDTRLSEKLYTQAQFTIKHAVVPELFAKLGYKLYNLSIFEIGDSKPIHREDFLTLPERNVLLYNTLTERIKSDILWNLISGKYAVGFISKMTETRESEIIKEQLKKRDFNKTITDSLTVIPAINEEMPKFVYAHFYLPHPPFFYNEKGVANDLRYVVTENALLDKKVFLAYLQYTNKIMLRLVDSILIKSATPPVIIVQSDHGFRDFKGGPSVPFTYFKNYTAYYFPDRNYKQLYDTMSNVNTFPILFNKYFNCHIPLQPDTSTFLPY